MPREHAACCWWLLRERVIVNATRTQLRPYLRLATRDQSTAAPALNLDLMLWLDLTWQQLPGKSKLTLAEARASLHLSASTGIDFRCGESLCTLSTSTHVNIVEATNSKARKLSKQRSQQHGKHKCNRWNNASGPSVCQLALA